MSYECCNRVTLNEKKNIIKVCVASSNVSPKAYSTCELCKDEKYTFDEKLLWLFYDLQSGNVQITSINDNTERFEYAMCKVREYLIENNINSYEDLYHGKRELFNELMSKEVGFDYDNNWEMYKKWKDSNDKEYVKNLEDKISMIALKEVYGKPFEVFKKALYEEFCGDYAVKFSGNYICRLGKYDRGYTRFYYGYKPLILSYKKAYIIKKNFSDKNLEIVKL